MRLIILFNMARYIEKKGGVLALIILSLIMGYSGIEVGARLNSQTLMYQFGVVGVLTPSLLVILKELYRELTKDGLK